MHRSDSSQRPLFRLATPYAAGIVFSILLVLLLWSCKDDVTGGGPIDIVFPDSLISYGRQVQPLFDRGCAYGGCHGPDTYADHGYSLDSYQNATNRPGIIIPYDPDGSILIQRIQGKGPGARMPLYRDTLTANQIRGLRKWVSEGARNN
jgi:mono/diheme cytochrome c family protein